MKIENQVCLLSQAKRLVEFNIGQDNTPLFVYVPPFPVFNDELRLCLFSEFETRLKNSILSDDAKALVGYYPAYTVAELGVMIGNRGRPIFYKSDGWEFTLKTSDWKDWEKYATEAEARAAMLIYLIKEQFITAEEVNQRLNN